MERWKQILLKELQSVAQGNKEVGRDVGRVEGVISQIPNATVDALVNVMRQSNLKYFADKLANGDYHLIADLQKQQEDEANETKIPVRVEKSGASE